MEIAKRRRPLLDEADFSTGEALAEMMLLEDHLRYPDMQCIACIHKHVLRGYAYAKEAVGLNRADPYHTAIYDAMCEIKRRISNKAEWPALADYIRETRQKAFRDRPSVHKH